MAGKTKWTKETALKRFQDILLEYGETLSQSKYDNLKIHKPATTTLRRLFGTWDLAKAAARPETKDVARQSVVKQNKRLLEQLRTQRDYNKLIVDTCMAEIAKIDFQPIRIPERIETEEDLTMFSLRSDAQVGQFLDEVWSQGLSHYSQESYRKRVERLTERIIKFKRQDERSLGLNKLVSNLLGDQVEGERIFKGQAYTLDLPLVNQLFFSIEVEYKHYVALAQVFNEVELFAVVGNHGRAGKIGEFSQRTNFDYIFYRILQIALAPYKNIKMYVSESPTMLVQHGEHVFALTHGNQAISYMGIPYYGIDRLAKKMNTLYKKDIYCILMGHHHQPTNIQDRVIINGSLPGGSDFSVNKLIESNRPSQKVFYFHNQKGINRESNLYLADEVNLEKDDDNIFTSTIKTEDVRF